MRRLLVLMGMAAAVSAQDAQLLEVRRIYVEQLTGGAQANQMHDMIIASLQRLGRFSLTEDPEKADAILKGSAEDLTFTDVFDTSEGITARAGVNLGSSGSGATSRRGGSTSLSVGDRESARIQERKHEASASVRLVNREGEILWSTTQESMGAKFRSSSADVAEKVARQLVADMEKLKKGPVEARQKLEPLDTHALAR
jgi:hypothetical protein